MFEPILMYFGFGIFGESLRRSLHLNVGSLWWLGQQNKWEARELSHGTHLGVGVVVAGGVAKHNQHSGVTFSITFMQDQQPLCQHCVILTILDISLNWKNSNESHHDQEFVGKTILSSAIKTFLSSSTV